MLSRTCARLVLVFALLSVPSACGGRATISSGDQSGAGTVSSSSAEGGSSGTIGTTNTSGTAHAGSGGTTNTGGAAQAGSGGQAGTDWAACTAKDRCILDPVGSCGLGCEPIPLSRLVAINSANLAAFERSKPPVSCVTANCAAAAPGVAQTANYYAECISGECQALDVRLTELSACATSSNCSVRSGTACCDCGEDNLIAVNGGANVEQVFCAPSTSCALDCASSPTARDATARCTNGHCLIDY